MQQGVKETDNVQTFYATQRKITEINNLMVTNMQRNIYTDISTSSGT